MTRRTLVRTLLDTGMVAALPVLMAYNLTGNALHEVLGAAMFAFLAVHLVLNRAWFWTAFAGKRVIEYRVHSVTNVLLMAVMVATAVSAVPVSRFLFAFVGLDGGPDARKVHVGLATWGYLLMALHLGFHTATLATRFRGAHRPPVRGHGLLVAGVLAVGLWGVRALFVHEIGPKLVFFYGFSFWDPAVPQVFVLVDYLALLVLVATLGHYALGVVARLGRRVRGLPGPSP